MGRGSGGRAGRGVRGAGPVKNALKEDGRLDEDGYGGFRHAYIAAQNDVDLAVFDPDAEATLWVGSRQYMEEMARQNPGLFAKLDEDGNVVQDNIIRGQTIAGTLIFVQNGEDFGMGTAGLGSSKIFWGPYSGSRSYLSEDARTSFGVDPIYVSMHEYGHAWGRSTEFDSLADTMALGYHYSLGNNLNPTAVTNQLGRMVGLGMTPRAPRGLGETLRQNRAGVAQLYRTYPSQVRESLRTYYGTDDISYAENAIAGWR